MISSIDTHQQQRDIYSDTNRHTLIYRQMNIDGYSTWTRMLVKAGWTPYFVNFMFETLPGRQFQRRELMVDEICRVYSTLVTNDVRRPRSPAWNAWLPRFFGCFDFPVYKNEKVSLRE